MLLLPALNEMIDITTTRTVAAKTHPPAVINVLLIGLVLGSALIAGSAMADDRARGWLHMLGFALAMSISVYMIFDLEYPRMGLIRQRSGPDHGRPAATMNWSRQDRSDSLFPRHTNARIPAARTSSAGRAADETVDSWRAASVRGTRIRGDRAGISRDAQAFAITPSPGGRHAGRGS
jgi:hypothetical protein